MYQRLAQRLYSQWVAFPEDHFLPVVGHSDGLAVALAEEDHLIRGAQLVCSELVQVEEVRQERPLLKLVGAWSPDQTHLAGHSYYSHLALVAHLGDLGTCLEVPSRLPEEVLRLVSLDQVASLLLREMVAHFAAEDRPVFCHCR